MGGLRGSGEVGSIVLLVRVSDALFLLFLFPLLFSSSSFGMIVVQDHKVWSECLIDRLDGGGYCAVQFFQMCSESVERFSSIFH